MRAILSGAAMLLAAGALGSCAAEEKYSQTQMSALQSRTFDAPYEATYNACVAALFDSNYVIATSDKRGGLLTASRNAFDAWSGPTTNGVQIKLDAAGASRTDVGISTHMGGQAHVDKKTIEQLQTLIERRLLEKPAGAPGK